MLLRFQNKNWSKSRVIMSGAADKWWGQHGSMIPDIKTSLQSVHSKKGSFSIDSHLILNGERSLLSVNRLYRGWNFRNYNHRFYAVSIVWNLGLTQNFPNCDILFSFPARGHKATCSFRQAIHQAFSAGSILGQCWPASAQYWASTEWLVGKGYQYLNKFTAIKGKSKWPDPIKPHSAVMLVLGSANFIPT